jgi:general secretion pathway protein J
MTLLEVIVSVAILAMVSTLIYGAFDGMMRGKRGVSESNQRYREGRLAIRRLAREIPSAFLSAHVPYDSNLVIRETLFIGEKGSPADRLDYTSFSYRRVNADTHESDQNELSYFGSRDPKVSGKTDLARRESSLIDLEANRGGTVQVLAEDIDLFDLEYLDPLPGEWQATWNTTSGTGQLNRLPLQVKVTLILRGGGNRQNIPFVARIALAMQSPLTFALP